MKKNSVVSKLVLGYVLLSGLVLAHALGHDQAEQVVKAASVEPLAANVSFIARKDLFFDSPTRVAQGDFNGDGIADLAVIQSEARTLSILIGNGDGTFQPPTNYGLNHGRGEAVAVGDFNGDGKLDIVAAVGFDLSARGEVALFLGRGDGLFDPGVRIAVGHYPIQIAVADFNNDGKLDLALADEASPNFYTLLGNGDGSFQAPRSVDAGRTSSSLALGDFNGDKLLDVALATELGPPGQVRILLGNGDGTFRVPTSINVGATPWSIVAGDHDQDDNLDLVVVTNYADRNGLVLLRGNGDGTFQDPVFFRAINSFSLAQDDMNGDGILDLIVANLTSTISVLLGNGDGTFRAPINTPVPGPNFVLTGDFNGDGVSDAISVSNSSVSVLLGQGNGTFESPPTLPTLALPSAIVLEDFDLDGVLDLAVAEAGANSVRIFRGNGDGTFVSYGGIAVGSNPTALVAGDFNGDGIPDLVVGGSPATLLLGDGTCGFSADRLNWAAEAIKVGDFNNDGKLDLALGTLGQNGAITIVLGNGLGSFRLSTTYNVPRLKSFDIGDFNNDSVPDLAVGWSGILRPSLSCLELAGLEVRLGDGAGRFDTSSSRQELYCLIYNFASPMVLNDFDGDGNLDLLLPEPGRMWMGNGRGGFSTDRTVSSGAVALAVDLDGDGLLDLVGRGFLSSRAVLIWFGNVRADFDRYYRAFGMEESPGAIAAGDLNGDGLLDLVAANPYGNKVTIFINDTK